MKINFKRVVFLRLLMLMSLVFFLGRTQLNESIFFNWSSDIFSQYANAKEKTESKKKKPTGKKEKKHHFLDSKIVKKIHRRQAKRRNTLTDLKQKGVIGEADNGFLAVRKPLTLKGKAKAQMEKVVKVENGDRKILYNRISELNGYSEKQTDFLKLKMFEAYLQFDGKGIYYYRNQSWQQK